MIELPQYQILDALIEQDACFAIFRLPNEDKPRFVMQMSGTPALFDDIEALNGQQGFVIAPFSISHEKPVIVIRPDCRDLSEVEISFVNSQPERQKNVRHKNIDKNEYSQLFQRFHKPLTDGTITKLVLSRSKDIPRKKGFSPGHAFFQAEEKYHRSCVFLFHTPQSGTWLGSTPEILLSGANTRWHTMALAGTRYPHSGTVSWDDKNLREQHLVTSYLLHQLSSFQITPEINGPYTAKAGNLAHLRTDFNFTLPNDSTIGTLLKSLHPTPAVSGLPKEEAFRFILKEEGYDRRYYTGFFGMLDPSGETNLYVNLRSLEIGKSSLTLFAGSGLISSSNYKDEWKETEKKLETMASIVN
jgi:isochorismate synthase